MNKFFVNINFKCGLRYESGILCHGLHLASGFSLRLFGLDRYTRIARSAISLPIVLRARSDLTAFAASCRPELLYLRHNFINRLGITKHRDTEAADISED